MIACPHCAQMVFRKSEHGTKFKLSRSAVVLTKSGDIEINCPSCHHGIIVGRTDGTLRKAATPRLIVRIGTDTP